MTLLEDYQFELDGTPFGIGHPVSVDAEGFQPGVASLVSTDYGNADGDSLYFGIDKFEGGPTWGFTMFTAYTDEADDALEATRVLAKAWRAESVRRTPGAVSVLRYRVGGRVRRAYGRPRNFVSAPTNLLLHGMLPSSAEFRLNEPYTYGDEERSTVVTMVPATTGGWDFPVAFPISTLTGGSRQGVLGPNDVGGDVPAPFVAEIRGPVVNPWVGTDEWKIEVLGSVAYDQTVRISTYPWELGAVRSDGANMALSGKTRLSKALLNPDGVEFLYGGVDSTGTSSATLKWRPRYLDW